MHAIPLLGLAVVENGLALAFAADDAGSAFG
jgi:hypothetical protein